ncbi:MAG: iron-sulfur cluster assembly scaffold protein [Deltaproteobacteria bacterium]|nr:iron-sulfur cluster assembly scaffold protein [Deltaproteobacteria bacterium]
MGDTLDDFVNDLQQEIYDDAREAYGETGYQRWMNPCYMGVIENPDGYCKVRGECGDSIEIYLKFDKGKVEKASFQTDGCISSILCGSFAAEMAMGKDPEELIEITGEAIIKKMGKIPEKDRHCAFLAANTLQQALNDYMVKQTRKKV